MIIGKFGMFIVFVCRPGAIFERCSWVSCQTITPHLDKHTNLHRIRWRKPHGLGSDVDSPANMGCPRVYGIMLDGTAFSSKDLSPQNFGSIMNRYWYIPTIYMAFSAALITHFTALH